MPTEAEAEEAFGNEHLRGERSRDVLGFKVRAMRCPASFDNDEGTAAAATWETRDAVRDGRQLLNIHRQGGHVRFPFLLQFLVASPPRASRRNGRCGGGRLRRRARESGNGAARECLSGAKQAFCGPKASRGRQPSSAMGSKRRGPRGFEHVLRSVRRHERRVKVAHRDQTQTP